MIIGINENIHLTLINSDLDFDIIPLILRLGVVPLIKHCLVWLLAISHLVLESDKTIVILGGCNLKRTTFLAINSDGECFFY